VVTAFSYLHEMGEARRGVASNMLERTKQGWWSAAWITRR
jgi:hypothetical protein